MLTRKGHKMGSASPINVDYLFYEYQPFSNKLKKVSDPWADPLINGTAGDFKDGTNGTADDYVYDANGNMIVDLNKNITNLAGVTGIRYNHLDKPEEIKINGKGTIKITYDADGAKLKREFISATGGGTKVTWYMGIYQYEEVTGGSNPQPFALSFISFSEGRIRVITPQAVGNNLDALSLAGNLSLPGGKQGSIDYFITDHRSDVRMILTEETQWSYTTASMETASGRDGVEANLFGTQVQASRVAKSTVPAWASNTSQQVTRLSSSTQKIGPNQLLKVMAGDQLSTTVKYYFANTAAPQRGSYLTTQVANIIGGLILSNPGSSAALKAGVPGIQQQLGQPSFNYWLQYNPDNGSINNPKANLSILFFDERFNFVSESSQQVRVSTPGNGAAPLVLSNIKAPKNGYCFIYISNESSESVYFDDLQVRHDRGRILEENHYYAYGLKIAALSSKAFAAPQNNYQYQGDYSEFDDDLGWNDFALRSYDPQIGRFLQHDPYDQFASGYVGMGNDPANMIDPTGGLSTEPFSTLAMVEVVAKARPGGIVKAMTTGQMVLTTTSQVFSYVNKAGEIFETKVDLGSRHEDKETNEAWYRLGTSGQGAGTGTLSEYKPSLIDRWSESENFFGKASYQMVDGVALFFQALTPGIGHPNAMHINGSGATTTEVTEGGVGTMGLFVPAGAGGRSIGLFKWPKVPIGKIGSQLLGKVASSKILGSNLVISGLKRPINSAAHHIVAGNDKRANVARAILKKAGIDINDAANGIFLPQNSKFATGKSIPHSKIHTNKYYREITNRLRNSSDVRSTLQNIGEEILNGIFPY